MASIISFTLYFCAVLAVCVAQITPSFRLQKNPNVRMLKVLPAQFNYKLGDIWMFTAKLKNLPPGGNATFFITYQSDTLGELNTIIGYEGSDSVAVLKGLTYEKVLVEVELTTEAGLCTKQRILEGRNVATSQDWTTTSGNFLEHDAACLGQEVLMFTSEVDFMNECNDNLLSGKINWMRSCDNDSNSRAIRSTADTTNSTNGTFNGTEATNCAANMTGTINGTCATNGTVPRVKSSGISIYSAAKTVILLLGIFIIL